MPSSSALAEKIFTKKLQTNTCKFVMCCNPKRAGMLLHLHRASLKSQVNKVHLFEWMVKTALRETGSPKAHDSCVQGIHCVQQIGSHHSFPWCLHSVLQLTQQSVPEVPSSPHFSLSCSIPYEGRQVVNTEINFVTERFLLSSNLT